MKMMKSICISNNNITLTNRCYQFYCSIYSKRSVWKRNRL